MQAKLTKPWGPYADGTVVADNKAEAEAAGGLRVSPDRFAALHDDGYFETERQIPEEVRTSVGPAAPDIQQGPRAVRARQEVAGVVGEGASGGEATLGSGGEQPPGESSDPSPGLRAAADESDAARPSGSAQHDEVLRQGRQPGRPAGRHPTAEEKGS